VRADLAAGVADGGFDAVYLSLHGAAITASRQAPELDLVRLVRELLPTVPLGASFDLHGNLAPEYAALLDVASVYRTHPHVDMAATAARVIDSLLRCADGTLATRRVLRNDSVLLGSFNMRTAGVMRSSRSRAPRRRRARSKWRSGASPMRTRLDRASVLAVQRRARPHSAQRRSAAPISWARPSTSSRRRFASALPSPQAIAAALAHRGEGLVAVTDRPTIRSPAAAATRRDFRALLDARRRDCLRVRELRRPGVVAAARRQGSGARSTRRSAHGTRAHFGAGVRVRAVVERLTDGVFRNEGDGARRRAALRLHRRAGAHRPAVDPRDRHRHVVPPTTRSTRCTASTRPRCACCA
jgi:microcystin degradation protein MlrC